MMHTDVRRVALVAIFLATAHAAQADTRLMRYPDVYKDKIVFTYEGDLWLAPTAGGLAQRITNDPGTESWPKFSPDGQWIAFTGQYDGGVDVYVISSAGGQVTRLTHHPAPDLVLDWFPDGKHILFRSQREYPTRAEMIYKVSVDGGMPEKLPVDRAGLTSLSPDGKQIAYNRISREQRTWKRHQGGTAQDIWMGSLDAKDYRKITDWVGTDNFPMWHGNAIYFTSDRERGTLNLYKYDVTSGAITALTHYSEYDVKFPSLGDDNIVYIYTGAVHLLNLADGKSRQVPLLALSERSRMRPEWVEVAPSIGSFSLSPTGKRLLLETRGDVVNVPVEEGVPINLTNTTDTREKNAAWSPDGKWVVFISDKTGEEELYLVDQKSEQPWRQLTRGGMGFRLQPVWSPDSQWLIFSDKFLRLNLVNAESGEIRTVDQSDYDDGWYRWGIQDYAWSPDSQWIAYSKLEQSLNESIFLYSMAGRTAHRVTDDVHPDWSPSFDPKGRYLYFLSGRTFDPIMGFVDQNYIFLEMVTPYVVVLKDGEPSPFAPEDSMEDLVEKGEQPESDDDKTVKDKVDKGKGGDEAETKDDEKAKEIDVQIDLDGIDRRIIPAEGVPAGNYFRLEATDDGFLYLKKDDHEFEKYQTVTDQTEGKLDLYHYDLGEKETTQVLPGIANYHVSADGKKLVYRAGGKYGVVGVGAASTVGDGEVKLDAVRIRVDRDKEFLQIFNEAWRVQRDWFYDPNMHGVDWEKMGDKYRKLIPYCGDRSDLNYLIGEMIGELNAGHTYVFGGDILDTAKDVPVGLLGADFSAEPGDRYYRIDHIIPSTPWNEKEQSPLDQPGCPIREGHYLIAIDGQEVTTADNVYAFLEHKRGTWVTLTYNDRPSNDGAKQHAIKTIERENGIRYREWVDTNRAIVDEQTGGKVGYLHIPDMGRPGLVEFARYWFPHHYKKGFIIDVRYNGGGFTSNMIIDRLERDMWALTQPREGKPSHDPERCFYGHMAVLINEDTGSSGEWFSEGVKVRQLAPLIGRRTWGGAVGIELHQPLVDGGGTTPPQFAPYSLDRKWIIEGHGVDPDIEVQNMPGDVVRGKDAQLEAGIANILERLAEEPMEIPPPPAYQNKSK